MHLNWVRATKGHRPLLRTFTCADPPKPIYTGMRGKSHPAMWTVEVQSAIRTYPVGRHGSHILLGFEGEKLAAVVTYHFDSNIDCWIEFVACSVESQGRGFGREAIYQVIEAVQCERAMELSCKANTANLASQEMLRSAGFQNTDSEGEYQVWTRDVPPAAI